MRFLQFLFLFLVALIVGLVLHFYFPNPHQQQFPTYDDWDNGLVNHIIPTANHEQFLIKVSFNEVLKDTPQLEVKSDTAFIIGGIQTDPKGRFWEFQVNNLSPSTSYDLHLMSENKQQLADAWSLKTYPHPDSLPQKMTILAYTCAGGSQERLLGQEIFLQLEEKHALLKKGLSFQPDIVIANGDHIYWDRKSLDLSVLRRLVKTRWESIYGKLDLAQPMLSDVNYETFTRIGDAQIAELYGCLLRSTPSYFLSDDHDLLENDEGRPDLVTLPPEKYMLDGATSMQRLYYPSFLPSSNRPLDLPSTDAQTERNSVYGSFRFGKLAEGVLFDCKRFTSLEEEEAVLVHPKAERWIIDRTTSNESLFFFHIPSSPIGWTAGKWSEWYPDVLQADGSMDTGPKEKYLWQKGWWAQHQRLLEAWQNQNRIPIVLQGDLHMISYGLVQKSGELDFSTNPIHAIGTGPLGSGKLGFPSSIRGTIPLVPKELEVQELQPPLEKNGFSIIEMTHDSILISIYAWRPSDGLEEMEDLAPVLVKRLGR